MQIRLLTIVFCVMFFSSAAQDKKILQYEQKIKEAKTDDEKISAMLSLAEYYSIYKFDTQADSILHRALSIGELSSNKELVLTILFDNNITNLHAWSNKDAFERTAEFIKKGLQYAQDLNRPDYIALANIRLANICWKQGRCDEAIQQVNQAFTSLGDLEADSLRCILFIEQGDIYRAKTDPVEACKNYNTALVIAYKQKTPQLQTEVYHRLSDFYRSLGDEEKAKSFLLQSRDLNIKHNLTAGLFNDYLGLAKITNKKEHIDTAASLANKLNSDRYKLAAKKIMYYWYMVVGKNSDETFKYLYGNPDLLHFFVNQGLPNFQWQMGDIYRYSGRYDSALHFYRLAETEHLKNYHKLVMLSIYNAMAETYLQNNDSTNAKEYYEKTFSLCRELSQLDSLPTVCSKLGMLHEKQADYKSAYYYSVVGDSANKILQEKAAKDKFVLLQIDRENKKSENDLLLASQEKERKNYLQIMAITLTITLIFAFMLFIGMFEVSKTTIRMLGYFAFISLFEFIILLLDHPIVAFTGGEPLKIWTIKIFLIAMLVPLQHFMEHRLISYLQSRKLLEVRQRFSIKHLWHKVKKTASAPGTIAKIEKDTAVL